MPCIVTTWVPAFSLDMTSLMVPALLSHWLVHGRCSGSACAMTNQGRNHPKLIPHQWCLVCSVYQLSGTVELILPSGVSDLSQACLWFFWNSTKMTWQINKGALSCQHIWICCFLGMEWLFSPLHPPNSSQASKKFRNHSSVKYPFSKECRIFPKCWLSSSFLHLHLVLHLLIALTSLPEEYC